MAWKIKRKIKRDGVCIMHDMPMPSEMACFREGREEAECGMCGREMELNQEDGYKSWSCSVCRVEGEEFGEPDKA